MSIQVVFVDDDADVRQAYGQALELSGIAVTLARALIEAVDHLTPGFPGVVVTDVRMPGKDGFDMLARVQRIDPEIPVIVLTGEGDIPMAVRAVEAGAYAFLEKPCPPADLIAEIEGAARVRAQTLRTRSLSAGRAAKVADSDAPLSVQMDAVERHLIENALRHDGGHVPTTAERLQLPRKTLYDKIKRLKIDPSLFRRD